MQEDSGLPQAWPDLGAARPDAVSFAGFANRDERVGLVRDWFVNPEACRPAIESRSFAEP